jgi:hypothetical protein
MPVSVRFCSLAPFNLATIIALMSRAVAIIGDEVPSHHEQHLELRGVRVENFRIEDKIAAVRHNWSDTY